MVGSLLGGVGIIIKRESQDRLIYQDEEEEDVIGVKGWAVTCTAPDHKPQVKQGQRKLYMR